MGSKSAPPPPDPRVVAEAQTKSNIDTAKANATLNRIDQYTPQGSSTYTITGYDDQGLPQYRQDTTLSAGEQNVYDLGLQARTNYGQTLVDQTGRVNDALANPFKLGNANTEQWYQDAIASRADPMFAQQKARLEQDLANKGIGMGTEAWNRAMTNFNQGQNDFRINAMLQGRTLANQEQSAEYLMPLNAAASLASGSQVSSPQFGNVPGVGMANTDVAGIYNQSYQNQLAAANMENQSNNAMMGGMFGLGAAALRFLPFSDSRLKRDIVDTGETGPKGLKVYEWAYLWSPQRFRGYMADEVKAVFPDAVVIDPSGYMRLDYARIG